MGRLKVLFVSSGNNSSGISPIVRNQARSLSAMGVEIKYFPIQGKGFRGYLQSIPKIRRYLDQNKVDFIHAHYSLSGFCAALAAMRGIPVICSLMGSDTHVGIFWKLLIRWFGNHKWLRTIIKSESMNVGLNLPSPVILPNGVNLEHMKPMARTLVRKKIGWDAHKRYVLFLADPDRPEKNIKLARETVSLLDMEDLELMVVGQCAHADVPLYLNGCDVLLLTSLWEGSPNVVKEAMACNRPIVSTDVGDVRKIFGDTRGCHVSSFKSRELAEKLKLALEFSRKEGQTDGRRRIRFLKLDSDSIAMRLVDLYRQLLKVK